MTTNDIRCPVCGWQGNHTIALELKLQRCPNCGSQQSPLKLSEDGFIKTNWQDIRILCIYAQRFCATFDEKHPANKIAIDTVKRIVGEMAQYQPKGNPANLDPMLGNKDIARDIQERKEGKMLSPYLIDLIKRDDDSKQ